MKPEQAMLYDPSPNAGKKSLELDVEDVRERDNNIINHKPSNPTNPTHHVPY
jgi:hypothetical protein